MQTMALMSTESNRSCQQSLARIIPVPSMQAPLRAFHALAVDDWRNPAARHCVVILQCRVPGSTQISRRPASAARAGRSPRDLRCRRRPTIRRQSSRSDIFASWHARGSSVHISLTRYHLCSEIRTEKQDHIQRRLPSEAPVRNNADTVLICHHPAVKRTSRAAAYPFLEDAADCRRRAPGRHIRAIWSDFAEAGAPAPTRHASFTPDQLDSRSPSAGQEGGWLAGRSAAVSDHPDRGKSRDCRR